MAASRAVSNSHVGRRVRLLQKIIEHVNSIIQIIAVCFADRNMDFASHLRAKRLPVLFEDETKIIFRPMLGGRFVDCTGLRVPERYRMTILASRTVRYNPSAQLL